jgi:aspartate kinase
MAPSSSSPIIYQNTLDPASPWIVQKYGGTSVGKFATKICEIVPYVSPPSFYHHWPRISNSRHYLEQHQVAIVCSARSGSTKDEGTTNLLIRAATEALKRKDSATPTATGTTTPVWSQYALPRPRSISELTSNSPRSTSPSPFRSTPPPGTSLDVPISIAFPFPSFHATIDLIRNEHIEAAHDIVRDVSLLSELEMEIDRDLEGLRSFICAAQVLPFSSIFSNYFRRQTYLPIQVIDEVSPRSKDAIVGVGEKLACKLIATILRDRVRSPRTGLPWP